MKLRGALLLAFALFCASPVAAQVNPGTSALSVKKGGTGLATGTSGGVPCFTAATTMASSVALTANAIMLGAGAGACPTPLASLGTTTTVLHGNASGVPTFGAVVLGTDISGFGTGVATALGNNLNASAGVVAPTPVQAGDIIYYNGSAWVTLIGNASGTKLLQENSSGVPSWTAAGGAVSSVTCNGLAIVSSGVCPPSFDFQNCSIAASVSGNNLTVALKDNAGSDPSAGSPCNVWFRSSTPATGSWVQRTVTAATSFVANASSTFGVANTAASCSAAASCPFRLWITLIDNGSTAVLGVVALTNASGVLPLNEGNVITTTACSACSTATALGTMYSTAAQASKAFKILGYLDWGSGLATAGTYASGPTLIQTMGPGIKKPGDVIQFQFGNSTGAVSSTSNAYGTGAAPANAANVAFTMTATPNLVRVRATVVLGTASAASATTCQIFRGASGALNTGVGPIFSANYSATGSYFTTTSTEGYDTPATLTQQFYTTRVHNSDNSTTASCPNGSGYPVEVQEIMGALPEIIPDNDNDPRLLNRAA